MDVKNFEYPEVKIFNFQVEDIIAVSQGTTPPNPDGGFGWEEEEEEPW